MNVLVIALDAETPVVVPEMSTSRCTSSRALWSFTHAEVMLHIVGGLTQGQCQVNLGSLAVAAAHGKMAVVRAHERCDDRQAP